MLTLKLRTGLAATILTGAALTAAGPQVAGAAAARCQVDGGGSMSEWTLIVKSRTNISCTGAKAVIRSCAKKTKVPGWKVSFDTSRQQGPVFRKTNGSRSFTTQAAGGSPKCVSALFS